MKSNKTLALLSTLALATPGLFAKEDSSTTSSSITTSSTNGVVSGKAVITTNVNGVSETKVVDLGSGKPGKVSRTWLGVGLEEISDELASQLPIDPGTGLLLSYVSPESPAANAGLQKNDVLVKLDDQVLITPKQVQTLVSNHKDGDKVDVTYFRKGEKRSVQVTLANSEDASKLSFDNRVHLNLGGSKLDLDKVIKDSRNSVIVNKRTVFVGPDGKTKVLDETPADVGALLDKQLKELQNSDVDLPALAEVKQALEKARKQIEKSRERKPSKEE